jgi:hypothetical protein
MGGGDEEHAVEAEACGGLAGESEVTLVDGIEGAAEDREFQEVHRVRTAPLEAAKENTFLAKAQGTPRRQISFSFRASRLCERIVFLHSLRH